MKKIKFTIPSNLIEVLCEYNDDIRREINTILELNNYDFNDIEYIKKKERKAVMSEIIQEIGRQYLEALRTSIPCLLS